MAPKQPAWPPIKFIKLPVADGAAPSSPSPRQQRRDNILDAMVLALGLNTPYVNASSAKRAALYTVWQELWFAITACGSWYAKPWRPLGLGLTLPGGPGALVYLFTADFWLCVVGNALVFVGHVLCAVLYALALGKANFMSSLTYMEHAMDERALVQLVPFQLVRQATRDS